MVVSQTLKRYARLLVYLKPYRRRLGIVLLLALIGTAVNLAYPYLSKILIDEALLGRRFQLLFTVGLVLFAAMVFSFIVNAASSLLYVSVSARVLLDMRLDLYRHLQRLSLKFYDNTRIGEILSRLNNDLAEAQRVTSDTLLALITNLLVLSGTIALLLLLNWKLFLVGIAFLPVGLKGLLHYRQRVHQQAKTIRERSAAIGSFLVESLLGIRLIKAFHAEDAEAERFRAQNEAFIRALLRFQWLSAIASGVPGLMMAMSTLAVLLYGGSLVIDGTMTLGSLVAFMAYQMRLMPPMQNLVALFMNFQRARASLDRVFAFFDLQPDVREHPHARELDGVRGEIEFDEVTMSYEPGQPVLKKVSFTVPAGTTCALVGPSGGGKSTIADLLLRFYDPSSGVIRVDGHDVREVTLESLRRHICLVDQETFLFSGTIEDNIRYGRPTATFDEIVVAAQAAAIHEFIEALPQGYRTVVGERGVKLSGGQRQRLAIARAVLRDPAILILDEATSALDWQAESSIKEALARLMRGRTTLIISHRLSLIQDADLIIVLENGEVVQRGRHQQLLREPGAYRRLFIKQAGALEKDAFSPVLSPTESLS